MSDPSQSIDSTAPLAYWVLPLVLAVWIPGLWWTWADAPFAFRSDLVLTMTLFVVATTLVILAVISRGFRYRIRFSLGVTTVVVLVLFQWSTFTEAGASLAELTGIRLIGDVLPVALGGAVLWLSVRVASELRFAVIINVALVGAVVAGLLNVMSLAPPAPDPTSLPAPAPGTRSVLFLLLDGYARSDHLLAEYGFDNSNFEGALEDRGFDVPPAATTNYSYTYASLSSMLDLEYTFPVGPITDDGRKRMRAALTGGAGLIPLLDSAGYEVTYIENAWGGSQCGAAVDRCIRTGLIDRAAWNLGQMTILAPIFDSIFDDPFNALSIEHLRLLPDLVGEPAAAGQPRFIFAHLLLPHEPLLLDANCEINDDEKLSRWALGRGAADLEARRGRYASQLECVNKLVTEAVDSFKDANPDGLAMITGDHGPASLLDPTLPLERLDEDVLEERMKVFSAYLLEDCPSPAYQTMTPVNGARLLANCAAGVALPRLPDTNLWAGFSIEGYVADITRRVRS